MDVISFRDLLRGLPMRAVAAFAARAARRVQPLTNALPAESRASIESAIVVPEEFARGHIPSRARAIVIGGYDEATTAANDAAQTAAEVVDTNAITASSKAYRAAMAAADAVDADTRPVLLNALELDLLQLASMGLDPDTQPGLPIDPSESGPLGPLWPKGAPSWFRTLRADAGQFEVKGAEDASIRLGAHAEAVVERSAPPLSLYFDVAEFSDDEIAEILARLSDLYRSVGGDALVIDRMELLDPASVLIPEGA